MAKRSCFFSQCRWPTRSPTYGPATQTNPLLSPPCRPTATSRQTTAAQSLASCSVPLGAGCRAKAVVAQWKRSEAERRGGKHVQGRIVQRARRSGRKNTPLPPERTSSGALGEGEYASRSDSSWIKWQRGPVTQTRSKNGRKKEEKKDSEQIEQAPHGVWAH